MFLFKTTIILFIFIFQLWASNFEVLSNIVKKQNYSYFKEYNLIFGFAIKNCA